MECSQLTRRDPTAQQQNGVFAGILAGTPLRNSKMERSQYQFHGLTVSLSHRLSQSHTILTVSHGLSQSHRLSQLQSSLTVSHSLKSVSPSKSISQQSHRLSQSHTGLTVSVNLVHYRPQPSQSKLPSHNNTTVHTRTNGIPSSRHLAE